MRQIEIAVIAPFIMLCLSDPIAAQQAPPNQQPTPQDRHDMHAMSDDAMMPVLGISMQREGSGTSWLPDRSVMRAFQFKVDAWQLMLHGNGFVQFIKETGDRGDEQLGSVNWIMGMARRKLGVGDFIARSMLSLEPLTVGECGYPDLLATGESCHGRRIHDRQHPHDLFMELAVEYRRPLTKSVAFELYGGPVAEPALGPVAYPHRPSAMTNPSAPITHHWLDSTHISFGVVTGGIFGRKWKGEVSAFNGREPNENRYDIQFNGLDSVSARASWLPTDRWALQVSRGHLVDAEQEQQGGPPHSLDRTTASATYHRPLGAHLWATTAAWGRNASESEPTSDAFLAETNAPVTDRDAIFGRFEIVQKTAVDLVLPIADPDLIFTVSKWSAGYARELGRVGRMAIGGGASASLSVVPDTLANQYGGRHLLGAAVFLSIRPPEMPPMQMSSNMSR